MYTLNGYYTVNTVADKGMLVIYVQLLLNIELFIAHLFEVSENKCCYSITAKENIFGFYLILEL